jgi:hypothetical protein
MGATATAVFAHHPALKVQKHPSTDQPSLPIGVPKQGISAGTGLAHPLCRDVRLFRNDAAVVPKDAREGESGVNFSQCQNGLRQIGVDVWP